MNSYVTVPLVLLVDGETRVRREVFHDDDDDDDEDDDQGTDLGEDARDDDDDEQNRKCA